MSPRRGWVDSGRKTTQGQPIFIAPVEERVWAKVVKTDTCWLWTGPLSQAGYGHLSADGKPAYTHRLVYEWARGPIPPGLVLDHLCRVRACCNPDHLEPVTSQENVRRGTQIGYHNASKTCHRGHDWAVTPPYLAHRSDGTVSRRCRVCQSELDRARRLDSLGQAATA